MKTLKTLIVALLLIVPLAFVSCEKDDPVPTVVQVTENSISFDGVKTVLAYNDGNVDVTNKSVMLQGMSNSGNTITSTTVAYMLMINNFTGVGTYSTATDPHAIIGEHTET